MFVYEAVKRSPKKEKGNFWEEAYSEMCRIHHPALLLPESHFSSSLCRENGSFSQIQLQMAHPGVFSSDEEESAPLSSLPPLNLAVSSESGIFHTDATVFSSRRCPTMSSSSVYLLQERSVSGSLLSGHVTQ